ncbi:MAG: YihY family inner membrane protein [Actinophytocola sp.]|nr:YihY family inner membrane protein [Actinophytocola sp.]
MEHRTKRHAKNQNRLPGSQAETPSDIPAPGWWQILRRGMKDAKADNVPLLAAGTAFYAFLAVFPGLIATLTVYGLVADPAQVTAQLSSALPDGARQLIAQVSTTGGATLTVGLVVSVLVALWSASSGTTKLVAAVNVAYDEQESRGAIKLRAIGLALTVGAIVFLLTTVALVAVVPGIINALGLGVVAQVVAGVIRLVLLAGLIIAALALLYRLAPDRDAPRFRWVTPGAVIATTLWLVGSVAFSLYVNLFGSYSNTYGALAGVIVFLLWLLLTSYVVLLGAEINAESEHQTVVDTTTGEPRPMGQRGAFAADTRPSASA